MFKLIIADDELDARDNMIACINWARYGLEIVGAAGDGPAAYEMILEREPDIVLIDIKMPGLSGLEVIRRVQAHVSTPPSFIIVSGFDDFSYAQQAIDLNVSCYLLKPFRPDDLLHAMRKAARHTAVVGDLDAHPLARLLYEAFQHTPGTGALSYPDEQEREIIACLSTGDRDRLYALLDKFLDSASGSNETFSQLFECFLILYAEICRTLAQRGRCLTKDHFSQEALSTAVGPDRTIRLALRSVCTEAFQLLNEGTNISGYLIRQTVAYIEVHYQEKLTLNTLAEQVYVSPVYLSSLFRKVTGKTITEYIQKVRIDKAKELLRNPDLSIGDVSDLTGYGDIKYFSQVFKKISGVTPASFRNQLQ